MRILSFMSMVMAATGLLAATPTVTAMTAQQRYPWNGKVDIVVTMNGASNDVAQATCTFTATNSASQAALAMTSVTEVGTGPVSAGTETWTRHFVWDAAADVGEVQITDVAITVEATMPLGGVQLWKDGPYWAECNVGASKPEEYGYYFWWGDTVGYKRVGSSWNAVDGSKTGFSFEGWNCPTCGLINSELQSKGYIDSTGNLVAAYDAATVHLGAPWRMPTYAEIDALISNCTTTWTTRNGVYGRLVTGKGDYASKSIFLPAAGNGYESYLYNTGSFSRYWSSSPGLDYTFSAWCLYLYSSNFGRDYEDSGRYNGQPVRPLREFAQSCVTVSLATAHVALDTRTGARANAGTGEQICFSPAWETAENGAVATVSLNGVAVTNALESGTFNWTPTQDGTYTFTHAVSVNGVQVGETLSATFVVDGLNPDEPTISPASGTTFDSSLTVSMACASDGATIHYTTNGTMPTVDSPVYKRFKITGKRTIKAVAFDASRRASDVTVAEYALGQCAEPTIMLADRTTSTQNGQTVTIARNGDEGVVRYTLDGTEPTAASTVYTGPFTIDGAAVVKAKVFSDRYFDSLVVTCTLAGDWTIGDTMGAPNQAFTTSGNAAFYRVEDATAPAGVAMRSGGIGNSAGYGVYTRSVLSTTVQGPGIVSFQWRSSCEQDDDYEWDHAEFAVDGVTVARINGVTGWEKIDEFVEGDGLHTITWTYLKDDVEGAGEDCVWVADYAWGSSTRDSDVAVPYAWIRTYFPHTPGECAAYESVVKEKAANGHNTVEEAYVAGLDPTSSTSELEATVACSNGVVYVGWTPYLNTNGLARVYRILGKCDLSDPNEEWKPVGAGHRFFKVTVAMPGPSATSDEPGPVDVDDHLLAHLSFDDAGNDGLNVLKVDGGEDAIVRTTQANVVAGLGSISVVSDSTILSGLDSGDGAVFIPKGTHLALPIPAALLDREGHPYTIKMKVKFPGFGKYYSLLNMPAANNSDIMVFLTNWSSPIIRLKVTNKGSEQGFFGAGGFRANEWETVTLQFGENTTKVFLNGTQIIASDVVLSSSYADCYDAGGYFILSGDDDTDDNDMYWADVRVYDGVVDP